MDTPVSRLEARDYVRIILRRWWFILVVALAATLVGGIIAVAMPKTYRAVATVVVPQQQRGFVLMGGPQAQTEEFPLESQALIAGGNETAVRTSKALAEGTLGPRIIVDPSMVTQSVSAGAVKPNLIRIEAEHENQLWAREFANQTALSFLDIMEELRRSRSASAVAYLEEQVELMRVELDDLLRTRRELQKEWGLAVTPVPAGDGGEIQFVATVAESEPELRRSLRLAEQELAASAARRRTLQSQVSGLAAARPETELVGNPMYGALQEQLATARLALVQLQARYQAEYPAVREMQARITELERELQQTSPLTAAPRMPDPGRLNDTRRALQQAEQEVAALTAQVGNLQGAVGRSAAEKANFVDREGRLSDLDAQIRLRRHAYAELLAQLEEKRISIASEGGRTALVDPALMAVGTAPSLSRAIIFSLSIGLFLGLALSLLLEALDDTVRRPEDITRDPQIRFLGVVPWVADTSELIIMESPKSPPAEAFRTLRSSINFALVDRQAKTFLVTSAGASEGKSLTVANLAVAYAQAGLRVVVVDTDLRRPTQHKLFRLEGTRGLTNVLAGEMSFEQVLQPTQVANLSLIASGPLPPNPAELLDSETMSELLTQISRYADLVLMDSPPAVVLTDALLMASRVDHTILVAAAGQVSREAFDEMVRLVRHARGEILGAVLNKLRVTAGDYYYYYYYYYYDYGRPRRGRAAERPAPTPAEIRPQTGDDELPF